MAVDGQLVARTVGELRATLPQDGDLLVGLGRVVEATRTVVGVDGTGLTLAHEDGRPRWVAVSDAAMELLEQIQHGLGEGPCLAAFAQDRVVAVEDLRSERVWDRLAAVVGQLQVRGVLSVPVRLADQPVGTLDVYASQPRAWTPREVEALGALAVVTAELVSTGVELADREVEVAQLRRALASRVWIEQAKGVLAATGGSARMRRSSSSASGRGRHRGSWPTWPRRSSRRPSASGSRPWVDDARVRAAEARAREAEQALRRPRPGWPDAPRPWTGPRTPPTSASGPPTSATTSPTNASEPPTNATGPPAIPSSAVGPQRATNRPRDGRVGTLDLMRPRPARVGTTPTCSLADLRQGGGGPARHGGQGPHRQGSGRPGIQVALCLPGARDALPTTAAGKAGGATPSGLVGRVDGARRARHPHRRAGLGGELVSGRPRDGAAAAGFRPAISIEQAAKARQRPAGGGHAQREVPAAPGAVVVAQAGRSGSGGGGRLAQRERGRRL